MSLKNPYLSGVKMNIKYVIAAASVVLLQACGGDNAPFFKTLSGNAPLVIVNRPGF